MPRWQFWKREDETPPAPEEPAVISRFNIRPRTDLVGSTLPASDERAKLLAALQKQREGILFDVERARGAFEQDNPWRQRIAIINDALTAIEAEIGSAAPLSSAPGIDLPPTPIEDVEVVTEEPPLVSFRIGVVPFRYAEELDWAERGFQLARSDLQREEGDPEALLPAGLSDAEREELAQVLAESLFAYASELRDAALKGSPAPEGVTLASLAPSDPVHGGWREWRGGSPRLRAHETRVASLRAELERLQAERDAELEEEARWRERLPIAERRLRDIDVKIAGVLNGEVQR